MLNTTMENFKRKIKQKNKPIQEKHNEYLIKKYGSSDIDELMKNLFKI